MSPLDFLHAVRVDLAGAPELAWSALLMMACGFGGGLAAGVYLDATRRRP